MKEVRWQKTVSEVTPQALIGSYLSAHRYQTKKMDRVTPQVVATMEGVGYT